ncbi:phospholipase A2-like isoform X1 [Peromyscus maniculatus bairdii]|uniref:phospholipase A2-like isoform X1 n=1 Tax=Peromyscus maniculatus bairdii TaxID=230844 RepID=UPI001C2E4A51|nr:phospholipase A2-like isoform X1 [Peromyscus maniculatus bairdii]XP_042124018.1 phospholipase A2-like isoform X1 [Peromyscus maniculatus bairdii]XP_042124019.1 phospholipase A2-like isoform X1 [Peromyscus maniculatus bairdii]XP_042124021.1 phospholipase A2-like isoform X1 [Peromyscus maniculatus bairdii]XP_042124022.1 phospholipase A2-like isoform X1 [Peromyscus maniculatus bairdii]XP_042124023.1 phospholipase A2-like isoform X1 [Peromyscus maniculatus bairdii]
MKLLLLVSLLTGATAQSISPQAVWQLGNVFECNIPRSGTVLEYRFYGCYCGLVRFGDPDEDLDSCCRTRDNCLAQVDNLENCAVLIRNPYTSSYLFSCSGNEVTCSDASFVQWSSESLAECLHAPGKKKKIKPSPSPNFGGFPFHKLYQIK